MTKLDRIGKLLFSFALFSIPAILSTAAAHVQDAVPDVSEGNPSANPKAVVISGNARFTVLTSRMIRMEWAEDGRFEDRASFAIINRNLPVPEFKTRKSGKSLTIRTDDIELKYRGDENFNPGNLSVTFLLGGKKQTWRPGMSDEDNLLGTIRTLDGGKGFAQTNSKGDPYEKGLLSRAGWSIIDESSRHLFVPVEGEDRLWAEPRPEGERTDWYILAYGHDYKAAIKDFTKVAGRVPLPPKYVFGYWWSRYWQYSDYEFLDLAQEIRSHNIPMDVMIIDMDWHDTYTLAKKDAPLDEFGQRVGWTGYTWQKQLFPAPRVFLNQVHDMGLKTALNLHPASGIYTMEDCYEPFVKDYLSRTDDYDGPKGYVGEDGKPVHVPYRLSQKAWKDAYFNSVIHPLEDMGVDFWWLDWQQWKESKYMKGLSNTFWLNHIFYQDKAQQASKAGKYGNRPLIYHRWGGLGSHRYQLGFSGDTYDMWSVLAFLPYFTATSSNVCYGYWGHDIGGHMQFGKNPGPSDPEMYTRWLQYGVFTPIFKTHSTKSYLIERRIWKFPDFYNPMYAAIRLRYTLSPYIYNAARQAYDTGMSICRPMYYDYPEDGRAYDMKEQFMFGDDILSSAICVPMDTATGMSPRKMWFPEGDDWYDMFTGKTYKGGSTAELSYTINETPFFVKAGAVIPMAAGDIMSLQEKSSEQWLFVAPGDGEYKTYLYEDDGSSVAYDTEFSTTEIVKVSDASSFKLVIGGRNGKFRGCEDARNFRIRLEGVLPPSSVKIDGKPVEYSRFASGRTGGNEWTYSGKDLAVVIYLPEMSATASVTVECEYKPVDGFSLDGKKGLIARAMALTPEVKMAFGSKVDSFKILPRDFMNIAQCGSYITEFPERIVEFVNAFDSEAAVKSLEEYPGMEAVAAKLKAQMAL